MKQKVKDFIFEYRKTKSKLPSVREIAVGCDITPEEVRLILEELAKDKILRKYPSDQFGIVSSYHIPTVVQAQEMAREKKDITPGVKEKGAAYPIVWLIIQVIMFVIAGAAIVVSSYFSLLWTMTFLPLPIAIILSVGIPAYIAIAPEGAVMLKDASGARRMPFIGIVLLITAFMALFFSMSMSIIGQFNARSELLESKREDQKVDTGKTEILKSLKNAEREILENVKYSKNDLEDFQKIKKEFSKDDLKTRDFQKVDNEIKRLKNEIQKYADDLRKNREEQRKLFESGTADEVEHRYNFYIWFSGVTGIGAGIVEFILYVIPALFCDIIAPLGIFVAVGLYRRRK